MYLFTSLQIESDINIDKTNKHSFISSNQMLKIHCHKKINIFFNAISSKRKTQGETAAFEGPPPSRHISTFSVPFRAQI